MKRVNLFLIILIASLTALIALTAIGFAIFTSTQATQQYPSNWLGQMWGGMGGMMGQTQTGVTPASTNSLLPYFGLLFVVLIGTTIVGIVGLAYYLLYPQIRIGAVQPAVQNASQQNLNGNSPYESVSKTLTEEERKIIDVLNAHNGKYLQKYIRKETGLSRLKTHRIIARLAERGIVSLEKTGNTNQVFLANWLQQQNNVR
jgi:predicted transcriptional regulator